MELSRPLTKGQGLGSLRQVTASGMEATSHSMRMLGEKEDIQATPSKVCVVVTQPVVHHHCTRCEEDARWCNKEWAR